MALKISDQTIDMDFLRKVEEISGQSLGKCMQCATCTAVCPSSGLLDLSPRKVILMSKFGQRSVVLQSKAPWLCASCHKCMVRCPRGIDITAVMEAIRQLTLRDNKNYIEPNQLDEKRIEELPQIAMVSAFRKYTA